MFYKCYVKLAIKRFCASAYHHEVNVDHTKCRIKKPPVFTSVPSLSLYSFVCHRRSIHFYYSLNDGTQVVVVVVVSESEEMEVTHFSLQP